MDETQKDCSMADKERRQQALTDKDIERLADEFESRILKHFYINVGKGLFSLAWKGALIALVALAAYGYGGGLKH